MGDYDLTHVSAFGDMPMEPVPAWTFPGRVLLLEGTLTLRSDGRYVTTARSRITMFGETTFVTGADSASWELLPGNVIQFTTGRQSPENQALAGHGTIVIHAGGLGSGGTVLQYRRAGSP